MSDDYDEDSWWSDECRADGEHPACDLSGCDCSCHSPSSSFQPLGDGAYRVSGARVSPTTGLYITKATNGADHDD